MVLQHLCRHVHRRCPMTRFFRRSGALGLRLRMCSNSKRHREHGVRCRSEVKEWQRYSLGIQYVGKHFGGASGRPSADRNSSASPSVQELIESALDRFVGNNNHRNFQFSSRTDAGVHALRNVLHVDLQHRRKQAHELRDPHPPQTVQRALNHYLALSCSSEIEVIDVNKVSDDFHARYNAKSRSYVYRILVYRRKSTTTPGIKSCANNVNNNNNLVHRTCRFNGAFTKNTSWILQPSSGHFLNTAAMCSAASELAGTHDFTTFRSSGCQAKSPVKTIDVLEVYERVLSTQEGSVSEQIADNPWLYCQKLAAGVTPSCGGAVQEILVVVTARSFMYNQVRNIVGYLADVGEKASVQNLEDRIEPEHLSTWARSVTRKLISAKDRGASSYIKAPPEGLSLVHVGY